MRCLFNACVDPCEQEAEVIIREGDWKYGLCQEHFLKVRNKKLLTLNYSYECQGVKCDKCSKELTDAEINWYCVSRQTKFVLYCEKHRKVKKNKK